MSFSNSSRSAPEVPAGKIRVLVIDDDRELCALDQPTISIRSATKSAPSTTESAGVERALAEEFQAVILDVNLPGIDGFEVLKRLRSSSDVPILMLTSRGEETDRIVGLEMGADDYLPKTFSSRELLARLRAVTRRPAEPRRRVRAKPKSSSARCGSIPGRASRCWRKRRCT